MILCDTGVIVASINVRDRFNQRCLTVLSTIRVPIVTTWPCITESLHLLGAQAGRQGQDNLLAQIETGILEVRAQTSDDMLRICVLMRKYRDVPMDFADASLVVAAEALNITRILTLDSHFYAYRVHDRLPFEVLP